MYKFIVSCCTAAALTVCASVSAKQSPSDHDKVRTLVDGYVEDWLRLNPAVAPIFGDYRYNDQLGNNLTDEYRKAQLLMERQALMGAQTLAATIAKQATPEEQLSLEIFSYDREMVLKGEAYPEHWLSLDQFQNPPYSPIGFAQFGSGAGPQPFKTVKDYQDFLKKIPQFSVFIDTMILQLKAGVAHQVVQPRSIAQKILPQLQAHIVSDPKKSVFWLPIANFPASFSAEDKQKLSEAYAQAITQQIVPSYRKLHDYVAKEYLPHARETSGWWALPNGDAWYRHKVKLRTTTDLTPDEIHQIGLREVARVHGEMEKVKQALGFKGDLQAFFTYLNQDSKFYFTKEDDLLNAYREFKRQVDQKLPLLFSVFPKTDYEVRPVEAFRAASSAGAYYEQGTPDGKRPGIFYLNTYDLKAQSKVEITSLSLHEAAPGHHFQVSLQQENEALPRYRRFLADYTAYVEGWALYAETLGKEMGFYQDPYQYVGHLNAELLRSMRLVVDTGLHAKRWTREQAVDYMTKNSAMAQSDVIAEVERYMVMPGQALAYKLGQLKIQELRRFAEKALGKKFDLRAFHAQILASGPLPLPILQRKIEGWVRDHDD